MLYINPIPINLLCIFEKSRMRVFTSKSLIKSHVILAINSNDIAPFSTAISSIPDIANDASWTGLKTDITSLDTMIESMAKFLNHFDGL